jgi:hypothetical protein
MRTAHAFARCASLAFVEVDDALKERAFADNLRLTLEAIALAARSIARPRPVRTIGSVALTIG